MNAKRLAIADNWFWVIRHGSPITSNLLAGPLLDLQTLKGEPKPAQPALGLSDCQTGTLLKVSNITMPFKGPYFAFLTVFLAFSEGEIPGSLEIWL
eukprot:375002-Amphidinium_carterae.1